MSEGYAAVAGTDEVRAAQVRLGSRSDSRHCARDSDDRAALLAVRVREPGDAAVLDGRAGGAPALQFSKPFFHRFLLSVPLRQRSHR